MLKQRIITALVLLALLVPVVLYPDSRLFTFVALVFISAGAWEMGRLTGWGAKASVVAGLMSFLLGLAFWAVGVLDLQLGSVWLVCACFWVLFSAWVLRQGAVAWLAVPSAVRLGGGILALLAAWLAVSRAHAMGINYLFSVLFLVWAADVGAYFAGRGLGGRFIRRKLAPSVSPGKTWEVIWRQPLFSGRSGMASTSVPSSLGCTKSLCAAVWARGGVLCGRRFVPGHDECRG
jgi:phosphatidate cytidylyltransferase